MADDQPRDSRGRFTSKGTPAVLGIALVLAAGGGGVGGSIVTGSAQSSSLSSAESSIVRQVKSQRSQARRDVKRGGQQRAWQRMRFRKSADRVLESSQCALFSHGKVREFLERSPCRQLRRVQFTLEYEGRKISVLVSRAQFRSSAQARKFRNLIDRHGTGDIQPVTDAPRFTGHHYDSQRDRARVYVAETEPLSGTVSPEILAATAETAVLIAREVDR